jgi:hypothetical protein
VCQNILLRAPAHMCIGRTPRCVLACRAVASQHKAHGCARCVRATRHGIPALSRRRLL